MVSIGRKSANQSLESRSRAGRWAAEESIRRERRIVRRVWPWLVGSGLPKGHLCRKRICSTAVARLEVPAVIMDWSELVGRWTWRAHGGSLVDAV